MTEFGSNLVTLWLDAAPWLVVGLAVAGLMRGLLPARQIAGLLGGTGWKSVMRAALIGTPLPLCSCSVLPAAVTIRRGGASRGATVSFLIATPENGVDSLFLSYALLGTGMTVTRLIGALIGAVAAGLLTEWWSEAADVPPSPVSGDLQLPLGDSSAAWPQRLAGGLTFAFTKLLGDLIGWLVLGVILAAAIQTIAPRDWLIEHGAGPLAKLVMLVVGVPMYICASASTPLAAGLLASGVSPGTVLVLLLAGPATNLGSVAIVRRELGSRSVAAYLVGIAAVALLLGMAVDLLWPSWQVLGQTAPHDHNGLWHGWIAQTAAWLLVAAALVKLLLTLRHYARRLLTAPPPPPPTQLFTIDLQHVRPPETQPAERSTPGS